jgi:hypothetical protein
MATAMTRRRWVGDDDEIFDDEVFDRRYYPKLVYKDGYGPHVSLMLTDAMRREVATPAPLLHRLGSVTLTDTQIEVRERARDEWSARKRSAWRTPPTASQNVVELATQLAPLLGLPPPKANATRPPMANDGQTAVASRDGVDPREAAYAERSQRKRDAWWTPWSGARR